MPTSCPQICSKRTVCTDIITITGNSNTWKMCTQCWLVEWMKCLAVVQEAYSLHNVNRLKIFANKFHQGIFTSFLPFDPMFVWYFACKTLHDSRLAFIMTDSSSFGASLLYAGTFRKLLRILNGNLNLSYFVVCVTCGTAEYSLKWCDLTVYSFDKVLAHFPTTSPSSTLISVSVALTNLS